MLISEKFAGEVTPLTLAEVDTTGFLNREISFLQKMSSVILIPTVLSALIKLPARFLCERTVTEFLIEKKDLIPDEFVKIC